MERAERSTRRVDEEARPETVAEPPRVREPMVASVAGVLALQRTAGNAQVAALLGRASGGPLLQRHLDDEFAHGGVPTEEETALCDRFARKVSRFVDETRAELFRGAVGDWDGSKWAAFLKLLLRGSSAALVWTNNAIEERVYAKMRADGMDGVVWVPQYTEHMGGVSFPDIVVHVNGKQALIDITSDRGHVLGKGGAWTTSANYIYVAEAWFEPVWAEHLPAIREAVEAGGISARDAEAMEERIAQEREAREAEHARIAKAARDRVKKYGSFSAFARATFGGNQTAAAAWLREQGVPQVKGMRPVKGRRRMSEETRSTRRRQAARDREAKRSKEEITHRKRMAEANAERRREERERAAAYDASHGDGRLGEDEEPEVAIGEEEEAGPLFDEEDPVEVEMSGSDLGGEEEEEDEEEDPSSAMELSGRAESHTG